MQEKDVTYAGPNGPVSGRLVVPDGRGPHPALIVVHEIWGLDDHIRGVARRFAEQGYLSLAPDLYTGELHEAMTPANIMAGMQFLRQAPPEVQRDPSRLAERMAQFTPEQQRAMRTLMEVMGPRRREGFAQDLRAALGYLRGRDDVDPARVGCLGFCMGGGLTGRLATIAPELRAGVIFYGENPPLDEVPRIQGALLGLYGETDRRITDTVPDLARAMARAGKPFEYHVYPGAAHAFFNDTRPSYQAEAAQQAWERVLAFLGRELGHAA